MNNVRYRFMGIKKYIIVQMNYCVVIYRLILQNTIEIIGNKKNNWRNNKFDL